MAAHKGILRDGRQRRRSHEVRHESLISEGPRIDGPDCIRHFINGQLIALRCIDKSLSACRIENAPIVRLIVGRTLKFNGVQVRAIEGAGFYAGDRCGNLENADTGADNRILRQPCNGVSADRVRDHHGIITAVICCDDRRSAGHIIAEGVAGFDPFRIQRDIVSGHFICGEIPFLSEFRIKIPAFNDHTIHADHRLGDAGARGYVGVVGKLTVFLAGRRAGAAGIRDKADSVGCSVDDIRL